MALSLFSTKLQSQVLQDPQILKCRQFRNPEKNHWEIKYIILIFDMRIDGIYLFGNTPTSSRGLSLED